MAARGLLYFLLLAISSGVYGQTVADFLPESKLTALDGSTAPREGSCGTRVTPEQAKRTESLISNGVWKEATNFLGHKNRGEASTVYVAMTIHVVRYSDGSEGIAHTWISEAIEKLNDYVQSTDLVFFQEGETIYIDDDEYANLTSNEFCLLVEEQAVPATINVYFVPDSADFCGRASYPGNSCQGVVVVNDCVNPSWSSSTFSHEIGHYLHLYHTHETGFGEECVSGSNCDTAGDLLCDTAADPNLSGDVNSSCQYVGSAEDACGSGEPYDPDTSNIMSYSYKPCRDGLSGEQLSVMVWSAFNERSDHLRELGACCLDSSCLQLLSMECANAGGEYMGASSTCVEVICQDETGSWTEVQKLTASDGAELDQFGESVSISGNYAVIGSPLDDNWFGSAYVFERDNAGNWSEVQKLTASDGQVDDNFGRSVSISGSTALIGAYVDDDNGFNSGSAYVFQRDGLGNWSEVKKLTASDGTEGDHFGSSVAISGDSAVIGAENHDENGSNSGSAYVFERDNAGNWLEVQKLTASDGAGGDIFGQKVSISGETVVIGSSCDDDDGDKSGSAYVFERDGAGNWSEVQKLTASDGAANDEFGHSVSISSDYAVISAFYDDDNGSYSGSAYVFNRDNAGNWLEVQKLTASDGAELDRFGILVSISGDYAVIGAYGDDDNGSHSGSAYVFNRNNAGSWTEVQKLTASDGDAGENFGGSVSISGDYVLIGADGDNAQGSSGSAYVYAIEGASGCPGDANGRSLSQPG